MVSLPLGRSPSGRRPRSRNPIVVEDRIAAWVFLAPMLLIFGTFIFGPVLFTAWVSFRDWDIVTPDRPWVGLANYERLFQDDDFYIALRNTLWYTLGVVPLQTFFALVLAVLANRKIRGISFFRTAYYFPSISSSVVISIIFLWLYSGNGLINNVLRELGLPTPRPVWLANPNGVIELALGNFGVENVSSWFAGPSVALLSIMMQNIWTTIGTLMVIYLAGLQDISNDVYEAASLDGASRWRQFWDITTPLLRPVTFFVVTIGMIGTLQVFDQIWIMSSGGPAKTTTTLAYLIYVEGFQGFAFGYGSAIAMVLWAIILVFFFIQRQITGGRADQ